MDIFFKNRLSTTQEQDDSTPSISVVNGKVSELRKMGYKNLKAFLDASSDHLYVGRDISQRVPGATGSKWQNPFKVKTPQDLSKILKDYENYVCNGKLYKQLHELKGKTLVCWCYPEPCHATVLKKLYEELDENEK